MWWYRRGNSGGSLLPEEKKANMWHGRGNGGGSWPPAFPRSPDRPLKQIKFLESLPEVGLPVLPVLTSFLILTPYESNFNSSHNTNPDKKNPIIH